MGKSGIEHRLTIDDARLARLVRRCHELPGKHLFSYRAPDGGVGEVGSADVNDYLRAQMGRGVSAKDFRTWGATTIIAGVLDDQPCDRLVTRGIKTAAEVLGNSPTVCRTSYVHPVVPESYREGAPADAWDGSRSTTTMGRPERAVRRLLLGR